MNDTPENPSENTPKVPFLSSHPFVASEGVEKCIVCGGDEPCSHDFDAITWPGSEEGVGGAEPVPFFIGKQHDRPDLSALNRELKRRGSEWRATRTKSIGTCLWNPRTQVHLGVDAEGYVKIPDVFENTPANTSKPPESTQTFTQHAGGCDWGGSNPTPENPPQDIIDRPVENVTFLPPRPPCPTCGNKAEWFDNHPIPCPECGWYTMKLAPSGAPGASQSEQVGIVVETTPEDVTIRYCTDTEDDTLRAAHQSLLEDAELEQIVLSDLSVRKHTEQELVALADWASDTKLRSAALNLVLQDLVAIEWKGNQPVFRKKP